MSIFLNKRQRRRRIACYVFIAAIGILYAANILVRMVYQDSVWELLRDFLLPLVIVTGVYAVNWNYGYSTSLLITHIPKVKTLVLCVPVVAAVLSCMAYDPSGDTIDFNITIFAMTSIYVVPYVLKNTERAYAAIVIQALGFVLLAANLGHNTAAMVTIAVTAFGLICYLPQLAWFFGTEEHTHAKQAVALVTLIFGLLLLVLIPGTGVPEAFVVSSMGRPGLGSSAFVNQQCARILTEANIVGPVFLDYAAEGLFADRVLTYVLAQGGWLAVIPLLLSIVLLITSGFYLCYRGIGVQYYISVSFMTVIAVQSIGFVLLCAGWDKLIFPLLSPFLVGGYHTLFFLMAICILPPKQKQFPESDSNSDEEDEDYLELDALDINSPAYAEELVKALAHHPRTQEGMEQLWSYMCYSDPLSRELWELLLSEYEEFMNEEFYEMVVARLRTNFEKEDFKDSFLWWLFS